MEYCIAHNPLLLQLLGHWFTFIYRKREHLAVGSLDRGLTCSRGRPTWVASSSPCVFIIAHFVGFVKGQVSAHSSVGTARPLLPLTSLLYHIQWGLSRRNFNFFHSSVMGLEPLDSVASLQPRLSFPLDIYIVSQIFRFVNTFLKIFLAFYYCTTLSATSHAQ